MIELNEILKPKWGVEDHILKAWNAISLEEQQTISPRVEALFQAGLPFELKQDKLAYIHVFALLTQLEVLGMLIHLQFTARLADSAHAPMLRQQLLDEIFHTIVFTKILFMLSSPFAMPPAYNPNLEVFFGYIDEQDPSNTALLLVNLIAEGWIEELFSSLKKHDVAPKVFATILADESRHVSEADLLCLEGQLDPEQLRPKLQAMEEQLIKLLMHNNYLFSMHRLIAMQGLVELIISLDKKHRSQLQKIQLSPSPPWQSLVDMVGALRLDAQAFRQQVYPVELTPLRKILMSQWENPKDPTMVGQFSLNVSCLDFFNKQFPAETITGLMMQSLSLGLANTPLFRSYLDQNKLYQSKEAYVCVAVKLPDCADHIGAIIFENCHLMTLAELSKKIRAALKLMVYCYKRRESLEKLQPELNKSLFDYEDSIYAMPMPAGSVVSVSNIGYCGYSQSKSPLRETEAMKFTLMEVERKPVWNKVSQAFEPEDLLPISISADHRIFDGNLPIPKMLAENFKQMFAKMLADSRQPAPTCFEPLPSIETLEQLISANAEVGYKALLYLQTMWVDFTHFESTILSNNPIERAQSLSAI